MTEMMGRQRRAWPGYVPEDNNRKLYGPNGEILLGGSIDGPVVGQLTRRDGSGTDVHLRTGTTPPGFAFIEASLNSHVTSNLYWDNLLGWQRQNAALPGSMALIQGAQRGMSLWSAPAGVGAISSFPVRLEMRHDAATASTTIESVTGSLVFSANQAVHLASNLTLDAGGTLWNLQDTSRPGYLIVFGASNTYTIYVATAGANPRPLTTLLNTDVFNMASAVNPPRTVVTRSTAQAIVHATFQAIVFDVAFQNSGGGSGTAVMWSAVSSPGRVFANLAGVYLVTGSIAFASSLAGWIRQIQLVANSGFNMGISNTTPLGGGNATQVSTAALVGLTAGSYVEMWAYQDSGAALNTLAGYPVLSMTWLGPM